MNMLKRALELRKADNTRTTVLRMLQSQGKCKGGPDSKFDSKELRMGVAVELEHTTDRAVAKEIAKDHLVEDPKYYTKLKIFESVKDKKGLERKILEWFKKHPNPSDKGKGGVHSLAESLGIEDSAFEEQIYRLVSEYAQLL